MYFVNDLVGIMWQCVGFSPAAFPNLTCNAERGMSQRNLKGSESPWECAERGLAWSSHRKCQMEEKQKCFTSNNVCGT